MSRIGEDHYNECPEEIAEGVRALLGAGWRPASSRKTRGKPGVNQVYEADIGHELTLIRVCMYAHAFFVSRSSRSLLNMYTYARVVSSNWLVNGEETARIVQDAKQGFENGWAQVSAGLYAAEPLVSCSVGIFWLLHASYVALMCVGYRTESTTLVLSAEDALPYFSKVFNMGAPYFLKVFDIYFLSIRYVGRLFAEAGFNMICSKS